VVCDGELISIVLKKNSIVESVLNKLTALQLVANVLITAGLILLIIIELFALEVKVNGLSVSKLLTLLCEVKVVMEPTDESSINNGIFESIIL